MKKALTLILIACLGLALLAGCNRGDGDVVDDTTTVQDDNAGDDAGQQDTTDNQTDTGQEDQTSDPATSLRTDMNMALGGEVGSLDPFNFTGEGNIVAWNIFETLFRVHQDHNEPRLATDFEVSEDGTIWTYHLRQGVMFSDGSPFTSADVAFSINAARVSPGFFLFTFMITDVIAVDTYTVEIHLAFPHAAFNSLVNVIYIVSETAYTAAGDDVGNQPVGTNAWMLERETFDRTQRATLIHNPYWRGDAPRLESVTFRTIPDALTIVNAFEAGEIDATGIPVLFFNEVYAQGIYNIYFEPTISTDYVIFNMNSEIFGDIRLRHAVSYALNRDDIIIMAHDGLAFPAVAAAPPALVWGAHYPDNPFHQNQDRARELFTELGITELPPLITAAGIHQRVAEIMQQQLAEVGVRIDIVLGDGAAISEDINTGNFEWALGAIGLIGDFFSYGFLFETGQLFNSANFSNPEVDALFVAALQMLNPDERSEAYRQIINIINYEAPYFYIANGTVRHATQPGLRNGWSGGLPELINYYWYR